MRILAIETSCDESAVAVIDVGGASRRPRIRVRANVVSSQMKLHAKFGGVVPMLAKREHQKNLVPVLLTALRGTKLLKEKRNTRAPAEQSALEKDLAVILEHEPELLDAMKHVFARIPPLIDAIAVTRGPGLAPALWVGVNFARALSRIWGKPLIPVNHLEGHIVTNLIPSGFQSSAFALGNFSFPALCLVVSGGHTELVLMKKRVGEYRVLGQTRDDAAGEAFDKVAKMMHLGFPGGPIISKLAEYGDVTAFPFPRPMMRDTNFDFSFSGLKTAVLYTLERQRKLPLRMKRDIAASFEQAAVDVLVAKTVRAAKQYHARTVMLGGGVAANTKLRHMLGARLREEALGISYVMPEVRLTGDNALMIALAGYFNRTKTKPWKTLRVDANLRLEAS